MPTGIGQIIANNPQLQEFAERCLSQVFDLCRYGDLMADDICEDMGITEDEMYWMFEQLGYSRKEKQYGQDKCCTDTRDQRQNFNGRCNDQSK